jgi:hypothetical protein
MDAQIDTGTLFTERSPRAYGYAKHADDEFRYMNLHADVPVLAAREILERWYSHFPFAHRLDLVRRFRSKNHKQHDGAFWELYLHELFRQMGYGVQVHPHLNNIETRPDFLLTRYGIPFAFVEARLAGLQTDQMTSAKRLENELYDALDRIHSPNFFLDVDKVKTSPVRPTFKHFTDHVERWLETLNPDLSVEAFLDNGSANARFEWEREGWYVSLKAIPRSPGHRGRKGSRSVGIMGGNFQWVDAKGELRRALIEKASKYGNLNLPFLIAINYMGMHCDREDWTDALYGSQAVKVRFDERGVHRQEPFRKGDGFWIREGIPRHTHVSAILGGWHISPWSMGAHLLEVYEHFSPERAIDLNGNLMCWYVPKDKDELAMRPGRSSAEILGIPKEWPGKWPTAN